ncbi:MAG: hypothetical protein V7696_06665 [Halioglobus sp.]
MKLFDPLRLTLIALLALTQFQVQADENASNPLAAVTNTDLRLQYMKNDDSGAHLNDTFVDGAFMASPKLKIKYELHYWETNLTGRSEHDWESARLKTIYFPKEGVFESGTTFRVATGVDYIHDFDNTDKGIGVGADQLAPFIGLAMGLKSGLSVIPLLQHFESISGNDFSVTSARIIAIKPLRDRRWLKLDFKLPYDWENDAVPAEGEIQFGGNVLDNLGLYFDSKFGIGSDRQYDWGVGVGLRFSY